jgi:hypothetical protein
MLSSSPSKIHEPLVIGVSPRLPDRRRRQELRNTRGEQRRRTGCRCTSAVALANRPPADSWRRRQQGARRPVMAKLLSSVLAAL